MYPTRITTVAIFVIAFCFVCLPVADAYVDPGSGSFVFQAIIGAILAVGVGVRVFWKRLITLFSRARRPDPE